METKINKNITISQWVNDWTQDLLSWALLKTNDTDVSQDLVQETFLAALKSFENFQNKSQPKTWLISILNHKISDHFSKTSKNKIVNSKSMSSDDATHLIDSYYDDNGGWQKDSFSNVWDKEDASLLDNPDFIKVWEACMEDLPPKWKEAITSKYIFDKKSDEISQELNISVTNYWQYISRAKVLLKKCIEVYWK